MGGAAGSFGNTTVTDGGPTHGRHDAQPQQQKPMPMAGGIQPISIDDCGASNPAGISADDATKLMAGGGGAGTLRWLYPYDGTVFPRGMLAPLLMWDGGAGRRRLLAHPGVALRVQGLPQADRGRATAARPGRVDEGRSADQGHERSCTASSYR